MQANRHRFPLTAFILVLGWLALSTWMSPQPSGIEELRAQEDAKAVTFETAPAVPPAAPEAYPLPDRLRHADLSGQTPEDAAAKSQGCLHCHTDAHDPHKQPGKPLTVQLGCVDCHGGDAATTQKSLAHVHPRYHDVWVNSGNPVRSYTVLNHERPEFVRFVNPGDLRIAHLSCGLSGCHPQETLAVRKSMMTHGCMLWGSALYNNGAVPFKWARYGESYSMHGAPQRLQTVPPPTPDETATKGVLPYLDPLPRFQVTQPGMCCGSLNGAAGFCRKSVSPKDWKSPAGRGSA